MPTIALQATSSHPMTGEMPKWWKKSAALWQDAVNRQTSTSPKWWKKSSAFWLNTCKSLSFANQAVKVAELGSTQNTPFEQAFSNLAHSVIAERAPNLLQYEVGFQLLDKKDDHTRAVGVFGFKVGDQWLYAPVFFLNGELKGAELLFIKNKSLFVPLKDNWINYLLGRKPSMLGKPVSRNLSHLGVLSPNLYQLARSPYKTASAANIPNLQSWAKDFLPVMADWALTKVAFPNPESFLDLTRQYGVEGFQFLIKVAEQYPTIFKAAQDFYGKDRLVKLAQDIGNDVRIANHRSLISPVSQPATGSIINRMTKRADKTAPDIEVVVRQDIDNGNVPAMRLSDSDHKELVDEGRLVRDKREDSAISKIYNLSTSLKLYSPSETNIYEILIKPNTFEKCLVIMSPYGEHGREEFCTVVSLEGDKRWLNVHPSRIFCRTEHSREAWLEWLNKQPDAKSIELSESQYYGGPLSVLITSHGQGTCPFRASEKYEGNDISGDVYCVGFDDHCDWENSKPGVHHHCMRGVNPSSDAADEVRIKTIRLLSRDGTKLRIGRSEMYVPVGTKKLVVETARKDEASDGKSSKRPFQPGSVSDVLFALQTNLTPLKLMADGNQVNVNDRKLNKEAAFKHLVIDWHMRSDMADALLKEAADRPRHWFNKHVKMAGPYLTEGGGPSAPGFLDQPYMSDPVMNSGVPTQTPYASMQVVQSMRANPADRELYRPVGPDPDTMRIASQAAQTGQKEVFDTAMVGSLLKTVRPESMIDRPLGDLMKGMSSLGTLRFQYLWHGQEFEDRFGAAELPELEDSIVNTFESLGDVVLKLKQKGVEPFAEEGTDVDLGNIAN